MQSTSDRVCFLLPSSCLLCFLHVLLPSSLPLRLAFLVTCRRRRGCMMRRLPPSCSVYPPLPIQIFIACNHLRRRTNISSAYSLLLGRCTVIDGEGKVVVDCISIASPSPSPSHPTQPLSHSLLHLIL